MKLSALSLGKKVTLGLVSLFAVAAVGGSAHKSQVPNPVVQVVTNQTADVDVSKQQPIDKIETKTETKTEAIPHASSTKNDATLSAGVSQTVINGVNGERTITYTVTYKNGKETGRTEASNVINKQPVNEVKSIGTKVATQQLDCPNGTYVNSAGDTICSPYAASSAPVGATAKCNDGTYSSSASRRGTCSGHGGVASWL